VPDAQAPGQVLGVADVLRERRPVGHDQGEDVLRPQGPGGERGANGRIEAAGKSEDALPAAAFAELVPDEADEDLLDERSVNLRRHGRPFRGISG